MVITDDFVYLHMPKTGGTFVEAALDRLYSPPRGLRSRLGLAGRRGVYIDTSRNASRRYCSNTCASRSTVAAYRARQKT